MSRSASRALRILETVGAAERPLGPTEIGQKLGIAAGTAFRGLDALERAGFVARFQASPRFILGKSVAALRQSLLARFPIRDVTAPYLRQLAFASGETVSLTVRLGWYGLRVAMASGTNEVTSAPPLGAVRPLAEGLSGRTILAWLPAAAPDAERLARTLAAIRARGFATEETAFARGRAALAFPVRRDGAAIAAIAIEGPVVDLTHPDVHDDLPRWRDIVASVERLAQARSALFAGPFDHLDAGDIFLG